jgi:hypothetical protein
LTQITLISLMNADYFLLNGGFALNNLRQSAASAQFASKK